MSWLATLALYELGTAQPQLVSYNIGVIENKIFTFPALFPNSNERHCVKATMDGQCQGLGASET